MILCYTIKKESDNMKEKLNKQPLTSIYNLLNELNTKYEIHYHEEEGEYTYLKEDDLCITISNPYNEFPLYIDIIEDEIILEYYKWHGHYFYETIVPDNLLQDIKEILTNKKCAIIISSTKRWISSTLSDKFLEESYDYQDDFKRLPECFVDEIHAIGGKVELFYWNPKNTKTIYIKKEAKE